MSGSRKVKYRHFALAFVLEVLIVLIVVLIFRNISDRLWAARWASFSFVTTGVLLLIYLWPLKRKFWSLTWTMALIFLFLFALPMGLFRWLSTEQFVNLSWMGLNGPQLHDYSTKYYYGMLGAPFIDMFFLWKNAKKRPKSQMA